MFKVNVLGSVQPTKVLLPSMIQRRCGRIVFVSSQAGQVINHHAMCSFVTSQMNRLGCTDIRPMLVQSLPLGA